MTHSETQCIIEIERNKKEADFMPAGARPNPRKLSSVACYKELNLLYSGPVKFQAAFERGLQGLHSANPHKCDTIAYNKYNVQYSRGMAARDALKSIGRL